jgi:hypothetical protein
VNYDELIFIAHPILGKPPPNVIKFLEKLRAEAPETADLLLGRGVEWALVQFPNGWMLSILRGCKFPSGPHPTSDYETCRFPPGGCRDEPEARDTIAEVQAEIDEVRAIARLIA